MISMLWNKNAGKQKLNNSRGMELNLLSLRSNFTPTAMTFATNSSGGCSPGYNGNPVSVHSQIELRTRHRMPDQKILVLERGKKILDMCYTTFDTDLI